MTQKIGLELDIAWDSDITQFLSELPTPVKLLGVIPQGPGGGNPCLQFECDNIDIAKQIYNVYSDNNFDQDDFDIHLFDIK